MSARVGTEYVGRARVFRDTIVAVDKQVSAALAEITTPLRTRLRRFPSLRHEQVMGAERAWRRLIPVAFRIGAVRINRGRTEFEISETRVTASLLYDNQWANADKEQGVMLSTVTLAVHDRALRQHWHPLAAISLHALARRIERGDSGSHNAILSDLAVLVDADCDADRIGTTDGFWLGGVVLANDRGPGRTVKLRSVRTWLPA